ncbi:type II toxin-antitoxin system antitoxin, RelB/DinJ family [Candidatus Kaiserbacteria bacterium]|nr:MAG: type II toxin-antitoxin system antitoxin, RelB/DinJ family [Candidatus Kaiserbacteria bacterium]
MTANAVVRARIDENVKEEASVVLSSMGLTISDAFRMMLTRIAVEKVLPFDIMIPNAETIDAIRASKAGETQSFDTVGGLMDDLNAAD